MDFPPPAHPGPAEDQLLVLQGDHRSSFVWEGQLSMQPLRPRRPDDLWEFIGEHHFHARVVARLQAMGFYTIFKLGRMQLDWSLITALVERWRPETHTFHLPTGEATITLEDVQGDAGGSRVALSAIRDHMAFLHPDITGETEDLHIERYTRLALLLLFGCVLFPNTSGSKVNMRFLHHLQELDGLPQYSWGAAVLAYLYRSMGRVWAWQRIMSLQPPLPALAPGEAYPFLPLASRWILWRGNYRGTDAHHNLPLIRDVLDMLVDGQTPYNDELVAQLPFYCSVDRMLWSTSVPMIFFDMVEYHATERVLRQFHRPQSIPRDPGWVVIHYQRDDRARLEQHVLIWEEHRADRIPPVPTFAQEATIHMYASWYRRHTRLIIGNPIHVLGERYRPYAGRHEALLGQEMQQHTDIPAVVDYGQRVAQLARRTLFQARDVVRLDHEAQYVAPEDYHRGRGVPRGRGRARGRGVPRDRGAPRGRGGRGGRRGGGPQQGGVEAPVDPPVEGHDEEFGVVALGDDQPGYIPRQDEPSSSMPSYNLQLSLPASQVTPSGALSITGTFDGDASSQPIFEATTCFDEDTTDAYIQEADETTVASDPASCGVDATAHPHIKRRLDDDDPDSVPG
ncbi:serine/threonine-protein phosphatase 7 long form homolog [Nicotiana sylvestris]|uniref:serine/threonine-protein phosphatase 7 long form homolog n=1 Tax=Nicotiana sylvestris TaxID=4096 RepID=UPI00388C9244